ncbi:tape measure protein, partial [Ellagibacter isourolithinifaciens]
MPSVNVGSASVTIMPSMSGFAAKVNKGLGSAGASGGAAFSKSFADGANPASGGLLSKFKSAGTGAGEAFSSGLSSSANGDALKALQAQADTAAADLKSAMVSAKTATLSTEAAQAKYNETLAKYGSSSSQAISAERNLIQAKYNQERASENAKEAEERLASAQSRLANASKQPKSALGGLAGTVKSLSGEFRSGSAAASGFSAKMAVVAGAVGGAASAIGARLFGALSGLSGEIADASDSAQKFASTLSFGDVDSSTIDALTASTQKYADDTIYDLGDIRNTTAQLAANGVDDYAQLAEAAGNLNAVAGGNADTFKSVAMVMTQTAGAGKLTTENWNQLADAIPGASGKLQEAMRANGAYTGNFRDAMEKGEISAEEFNQAIMQLGMTDVAKEAATSTATIEGAMGNLEASAVSAGTKVLDAFKPIITGGMSAAGGVIDGIGDSVADFLAKCADNGAVQTLSDGLSLLGGAALDAMGAVGNLAAAVLGIEPGAGDAAGAADTLKSALDAAHPIVQKIADGAAWLKDNAAKAAPAVRALAVGFVAMKAASAVAGAVKSLSGTLTAVSTLSTFAAAGLTAMAGG